MLSLIKLCIVVISQSVKTYFYGTSESDQIK